jgi:hypothetical protein
MNVDAALFATAPPPSERDRTFDGDLNESDRSTPLEMVFP